jgi:hypothetical protein
MSFHINESQDVQDSINSNEVDFETVNDAPGEREDSIEPMTSKTSRRANFDDMDEDEDFEDEEMASDETDGFVDEELSEEDLNFNLDQIDNILDLDEKSYPKFTLAKNKARFLRMVNWYRAKEEWIDVAPLSGVSKLFKQQSKELEGIRANKLDYEMELETGTLTPSQRSYKRDELKMCKVQEKMAVHLITKLQKKIKSGRR